MSLKRFYVNKENVSKNTVIIEKDEHNHLKNVLRLQVGNNIIVVCGDEFDYVCQIKSVDKAKTVAKIINTVKNQHNSNNNITVFQGLIRKDNMALVVQKLNELGVHSFVPIETRFITAKDKFNNTEKLQKISNQSAKQCKRSIPMKVLATQSFKDFIKMLSNFDVVVFANEQEGFEGNSASEMKDDGAENKNKLIITKNIGGIFSTNTNENNKVKDSSKDLITTKNIGTITIKQNQLQKNSLSNLNLNINQKIAIVVGSEGGFDAPEINEIIKTGAKSVSLGKRILRAETAAIALSAIVMHKIGEI